MPPTKQPMGQRRQLLVFYPTLTSRWSPPVSRTGGGLTVRRSDRNLPFPSISNELDDVWGFSQLHLKCNTSRQATELPQARQPLWRSITRCMYQHGCPRCACELLSQEASSNDVEVRKAVGVLLGHFPGACMYWIGPIGNAGAVYSQTLKSQCENSGQGEKSGRRNEG